MITGYVKHMLRENKINMKKKILRFLAHKNLILKLERKWFEKS